jgi:hypothetical protein
MSLLQQGGSYIGFTTEALTGQKRDEYVGAIRDGITQARGDPSLLGEILLYDANQIADWASRHPAVAIWLAEQVLEHSLAGFRTLESWGGRDDFKNDYAADGDARYQIGARQVDEHDGRGNLVNAKVAWARIQDRIIEPGTSVRVVGNSGLGKSRFVYEALRNSQDDLGAIIRSTTIFADYRTVVLTLLSTAEHLAQLGSRSLLVVDECPRDMASKLGAIAGAPTAFSA